MDKIKPDPPYCDETPMANSLCYVFCVFLERSYIGQCNCVVIPEQSHEHLITEAVKLRKKLKTAVYLSTVRIQTILCP